jgi:hypothetical protein
LADRIYLMCFPSRQEPNLLLDVNQSSVFRSTEYMNCVWRAYKTWECTVHLGSSLKACDLDRYCISFGLAFWFFLIVNHWSKYMLYLETCLCFWCSVFNDECLLVPILANMEFHGMGLDRSYFRQYQLELEHRIKYLELLAASVSVLDLLPS